MKKRTIKVDPLTGMQYKKGSIMDIELPNLGDLMKNVELPTLGGYDEPGKKKGKPRAGIGMGLLKRIMARSHGNCESCGKSLWNLKIDIHHKNYDPTDNRESNLMVLCKDCHKKFTGPPPKKQTRPKSD